MKHEINPRTDGGLSHLSTDEGGRADITSHPGDIENEILSLIRIGICISSHKVKVIS